MIHLVCDADAPPCSTPRHEVPVDVAVDAIDCDFRVILSVAPYKLLHGNRILPAVAPVTCTGSFVDGRCMESWPRAYKEQAGTQGDVLVPRVGAARCGAWHSHALLDRRAGSPCFSAYDGAEYQRTE